MVPAPKVLAVPSDDAGRETAWRGEHHDTRASHLGVRPCDRDYPPDGRQGNRVETASLVRGREPRIRCHDPSAIRRPRERVRV